MIERSCVHPFIEQAQKAFQNGSGLKSVLETVKPYQQKVNGLVKNVSAGARIPHAIGISAVGLGTLAIYEYARAHGAPLPDSKEVITALLPVASVSPEDNQVTYDLHNTDTGFYSKDDLPKGVGGKSVEWNFIEPKQGGHDATFTGHTKK